MAEATGTRMFTAAFSTTLLTVFAYFMCLGILQPELPRYVVHDLGGNGTAVGLAFGSYTITACAFRPWAGRLASERGTRFVILVGSALVAASVLLYGVARQLGVLVVCRGVTGVGEAAAYVGLAKMTYDLAPAGRREEATSFFTVGLFGGFALGPLLGETLRSAYGFRSVWVTAAAFALLATAISVRLPRWAGAQAPRPRERSTRMVRGRGRLGTVIQRDAAGPSVVLGLAMASYVCLSTFVPLYVGRLGLTSAGPVLAEVALITLLFRLFGARVPGRLGPTRCATGSAFMMAIAWAMMASWATPTGLYVSAAVLALGVAFSYPSLFSLAVARAPVSQQGAAVATATLFVDVAVGAGALLLGAIDTIAGGPRAAFVTACLFNVVALGLVAGRRQWMRVPS